jgi:superfamily II DNA or RNA helicase
MILTSHVARQVAGDVQRRGRQYYASGAVKILDGNERSVRALVQGTEQYEVRLTREGKRLKIWCTCPFYQDRLDPCKHIWATLLACEHRGLLLGYGGSGRLQLIDDEEAFYEWQEQKGWAADPEAWNASDNEEWNDRRGSADPAGRDYAYWQPKPKRRSRRSAKRAARVASWKKRLAGLRGEMQRDEAPGNEAWPAGREILYVVDVAETLESHGLTIELASRQRKKNGDWGKPKTQRIPSEQIDKLPDPEDRRLLALLVGAREERPYYYGYSYPDPYYDSAACRYRLTEPMLEMLVPGICRTGRCFLRRSPQDLELAPLHWDEGEPWEFWLRLTRGGSGKHYLVQGDLRREEEHLALAQPVLLIQGGLIFTGERVARLRDFGAFEWISLLRKQRPLTVPVEQQGDLLKELLELPRLPRLDLPEELRFEELALTPQPRLKVRAPDRYQWGPERLRGELSFAYEDAVVPHSKPGRGIYQADQKRLILRDEAAERAAAERLEQLGFRFASSSSRHEWQLAPRNLPGVVRALLEAGWHLEAEGKLYRQPGAIHIEVSSGIDWFELHGTVEFGDKAAKLPELLAALKHGETTVQLDDGTFGMLPEAWLKKYGLLAGLGTAEDDHLRFRRSQVGLLDALLASQPEATCDAVFGQVRDELRRFEGIERADPPADFVGQLRGYQQDGLGWLSFLQKFGFGGCLADDMGLGKTIQVLALLESRRALKADQAPARNGAHPGPGPSLVVVPRSLVFNWKQEAARFTPNLRVLDHTGASRSKAGEHFEDFDVVLTTYGTLRRDALLFKDLRFDYCILDEAQAIKNASSESAKAARLLKGDYRLALSGTPVENHLGELWSLFEFLNPGMLGSASVFRLGGAGARNPDEETRSLLARALRPFILRRTKDQVAKDLPQKSEQTIYCELEPAQRKLYDELREHYRQTLLGRIEREGINKSKIQILEALLRLRQAACHPGLIDKKKAVESSAKLDTLLPQVTEVLDEGHKALVFSQFTSLLAIVRNRLDAEGIPYEYLDGRTRDRASRVERFQNDPECKLFLISLKAGGLGLNLTAAEYVFLLDPWWNPAVEAQAIDRTHRIGQTRPVFAYRLIARDTVEEKVLELQQCKRALADAIINADNSLIRNLGREDLELLLS